MELREILAKRLRALMDERPDLDTQTKIHQRSAKVSKDGRGISQSTVQRVLKKEVHTSLDVLEILAAIFGVSPLDLLKATDAMDHSETITNYDERHLLLAWRCLADADKHKVMAFISVARPPVAAPEVKLKSVREVLPEDLRSTVRRTVTKSSQSKEVKLNAPRGSKRKGSAA
jgi:transcriptional regulator with XRE-family HTH domain